MAVTKQVYTLSPGWTTATLAALYRSAFIDAGWMTDWFDSFTNSSSLPCRVLKVTHDNTKTYGTTYYLFVFNTDYSSVSISTGWDVATHVPTGTQYLDYHVLPNAVYTTTSDYFGTSFGPTINTSITFNLVRYTSIADNKQTWFQTYTSGSNTGRPFTILHPNTSLYSWLDLSKGCISGYTNLSCQTTGYTGYVTFWLQENIRRALLIGSGLNGYTSPSNGGQSYHGAYLPAMSYCGVGNKSNDVGNNFSGLGSSRTSTTYLPIGRSGTNPAYTSDYIPVCTGVPWSPYTSTGLASDFAVYMHYANNTITIGDTFVVTAGVEEYEVIAFANSSYLNDGACPMFLARTV